MQLTNEAKAREQKKQSLIKRKTHENKKVKKQKLLSWWHCCVYHSPSVIYSNCPCSRNKTIGRLRQFPRLWTGLLQEQPHRIRQHLLKRSFAMRKFSLQYCLLWPSKYKCRFPVRVRKAHYGPHKLRSLLCLIGLCIQLPTLHCSRGISSIPRGNAHKVFFLYPMVSLNTNMKRWPDHGIMDNADKWAQRIDIWALNYRSTRKAFKTVNVCLLFLLTSNVWSILNVEWKKFGAQDKYQEQKHKTCFFKSVEFFLKMNENQLAHTFVWHFELVELCHCSADTEGANVLMLVKVLQLEFCFLEYLV